VFECPFGEELLALLFVVDVEKTYLRTEDVAECPCDLCPQLRVRTARRREQNAGRVKTTVVED